MFDKYDDLIPFEQYILPEDEFYFGHRYWDDDDCEAERDALPELYAFDEEGYF